MSETPDLGTGQSTPTAAELGILTDDRPGLSMAVTAGVLAAAIGAAGWTLMVIETDHSYGIAAIGLGLLSGALVSRASGGRRSMALVAVGLGSLVVALVVGKYAAFAYEVHRYAVAQYGSAGGSAFGYLSANIWHAFRASLSQEFSAYYLLWTGVGGFSIWRALSPTAKGARPAAAHPPPPQPL